MTVDGFFLTFAIGALYGVICGIHKRVEFVMWILCLIAAVLLVILSPSGTSETWGQFFGVFVPSTIGYYAGKLSMREIITTRRR